MENKDVSGKRTNKGENDEGRFYNPAVTELA